MSVPLLYLWYLFGYCIRIFKRSVVNGEILVQGGGRGAGRGKGGVERDVVEMKQAAYRYNVFGVQFLCLSVFFWSVAIVYVGCFMQISSWMNPT